MLRRFLTPACLCLALGLAAACDRAPTEPGASALANYLAAADKSGAGARGTLPALMREVINGVEKEEGQLGVETALADWHSLQSELKTEAVSSDRSVIQAKLAAIHAEELKIVLRELGLPVVSRVISETNVGVAEAVALITSAQAGGEDMGRALLVTEQIKQLNATATNELRAGEYVKALDVATQSAALLGGLNYYLVELRRIPGLETLYPQAVDRISAEKGAAAANALTAKVDELNAQARAALRAGNRAAAHQKLDDVREQQIQVVLDVLGTHSAKQLVDAVEQRTSTMRAILSGLKSDGREVTRYERMLREANDLQQRADSALAKGDAATALDLSSHAAGLLNALQHLTR